MHLEEKTCSNYKCGKAFMGDINNDLCDECRKIVEAAKKEKWLKEWRGDLKLEERIVKIEEWIYEFRNHKHFSISDQIF